MSSLSSSSDELFGILSLSNRSTSKWKILKVDLNHTNERHVFKMTMSVCGITLSCNYNTRTSTLTNSKKLSMVTKQKRELLRKPFSRIGHRFSVVLVIIKIYTIDEY